jgi:hypothetical protein
MYPCRMSLCYYEMARPLFADGEDGLQMWSIAADVLNKKSRAADTGWSSSLGVLRTANNYST